MVANAFIEIIILAILIWVFESKIIPQIIMLFLSIILAVLELQAGTDPKYLFFFAVTGIYAGLQIWESLKGEE